jgi:ketosteroid isomerase-like protein
VASANVELVRSIFVAWERGDYGSSEWAHPEIEYVHASGPAPGRWRGKAAMAASWREFLTAWEDWSVQADEYRELDDERVLVLTHYRGRGKSSGLDLERMETRGASLFHIRHSRVTKLVLYWDPERALVDPDFDPGGDFATQ